MAEPVNSIDAAQRVGFLGTPEGWREVCRLYRRRMSAHDCEQMAKLRTYIEEGLLVVVRPEHVSGVAPSDGQGISPTDAAGKPQAPCSDAERDAGAKCFVMCNACGSWKEMKPGNHHPWCGCGSDNFRWEDERDHNPNDPATWRERLPSTPPAQDAPTKPTLICPRCKVDRFKQDCPNRLDCPMVATAQGAQP